MTTKSDDDMERLGRIDRILLAAIDQASTPTTDGFYLKSTDAISLALAGIRREVDLDGLCNLLVIEALYGRFEIVMRARDAVPDDEGNAHIPRGCSNGCGHPTLAGKVEHENEEHE